MSQTAGTARTDTNRTMPCGSVAPSLRRVLSRNMQGSSLVPVLCNRPSGHEGNHAYSTDKQARAWEWTPAEIIRST